MDVVKTKDLGNESKNGLVLASISVLAVSDNIIRIQSNINGKRRKISKTLIDVSVIMNIVKSYLIDKKSLIHIQEEMGINRNVLVGIIKVKFPQLCQAYKQSEDVRKLLESFNIYNYEELHVLKEDGLARIQENREQNRLKIDNESAAALVLNQKSKREVSRTVKISLSNLKVKILKSKACKEVLEDIFKRTTGNIKRVLIVSGYVTAGESYSDIVRKLKDEHSIESSRPAIRRDMEKRLLELCNIYKEDGYIRKQFEMNGINNFEELEKIFHDVTAELMFRENNNKLVAKKATRKNRLTIEMADYIIDQYNGNKGRIVTITELKEKFKAASTTISICLKGRLFFLDNEKYQKVMKIWAQSESFAVKNSNSYTNNLG